MSATSVPSMSSTVRVVIIGSGLSGLTLAYRLLHPSKQCSRPVSVTILEARSRIGGRTVSPSSSNLDLGASWIWDDFFNLHELVRELDIDLFDQFGEGDALYVNVRGKPQRMPHMSHGGRRIKEGTAAICKALASRLPPDTIQLNSPVTHITYNHTSASFTLSILKNESTTHLMTADCVIVSIPPRLSIHSIQFEPSLPSPVIQELKKIPTWMSGVVKTVLVYEAPFWREAGLSGFAKSQEFEFHEASYPLSHTSSNSNHESTDTNNSTTTTPPPNEVYALFCFSSPPFKREDCVNTAVKLYGEKAKSPVRIESCDWSAELYTSGSSELTKLYGHPYASEAIRGGMYDNRMWFGGSECSSENAGYMEGAVIRANQVYEEIFNTHLQA